MRIISRTVSRASTATTRIFRPKTKLFCRESDFASNRIRIESELDFVVSGGLEESDALIGPLYPFSIKEERFCLDAHKIGNKKPDRNVSSYRA